jgi:hypothetical protein
MEVLKRHSWLFLVLTLSGCGLVGSTTVVQPLDTDTYISSGDPSNHSELTYLRLSKSPALEERVIVKLPTGQDNVDQNIQSALQNPADVLVLGPFIIFLAILQALLGCGSPIIPQSLTQANLVFNVLQTQEASLNGQITLQLLAKPWWQTVNWAQAYPFTLSGMWAVPGGDVDPSFTPVVGTLNGQGELSFDITSYFSTMIEQQNTIVHYGMMLTATNSSLSQTDLVSTQGADVSTRPAVVSTYSCLGGSAVPTQQIFRLGTPISRLP